eukprot:TRINITY_DN3578_c0_g2_i5.p1 TRINITY_DN3578_c0_g2~~TRINITY_DN3578_c0_g2_i5.p1  ORF type:complete len:121 (+),score=52.94 TRINITY_DN3578_c0_g2_i5:267-629(+)
MSNVKTDIDTDDQPTERKPLKFNNVCILLVKLIDDENSRFYLDFSNETEALAAITEMYEQVLRKERPDKNRLLYSLSDLIEFVEEIQEMVLLVYEKTHKGFLAHGKSWIKALILSQAGSC